MTSHHHLLHIDTMVYEQMALCGKLEKGTYWFYGYGQRCIWMMHRRLCSLYFFHPVRWFMEKKTKTEDQVTTPGRNEQDKKSCTPGYGLDLHLLHRTAVTFKLQTAFLSCAWL